MESVHGGRRRGAGPLRQYPTPIKNEVKKANQRKYKSKLWSDWIVCKAKVEKARREGRAACETSEAKADFVEYLRLSYRRGLKKPLRNLNAVLETESSGDDSSDDFEEVTYSSNL
jgi:hypothetical protein